MSVYLENAGDPTKPLPSKPEGARTLGIYTTQKRAIREQRLWGRDTVVCQSEEGWEVVRLPYRGGDHA